MFFFCYDDTSHRKKSECFLSDALFTNSLNGRVLWGKEAQLRNLQRRRADGRFHESVHVCSLVHKVFAQEVHLRHRGHVDLDFLFSSFLPEVFHRPPVQAGSESDASQHSWSALWRTEKGQETLLETLQHTVNATQTQLTSCPCHVTQ